MTHEKLQKVLATAGFGSRRAMERAIEAGLIQVNGQNATLGMRVTPGDKLLVNGQRFVVPKASEARSELRVILYNKPEGEICSRNDPEGRPSVFDRLPPLAQGRWISVGRLDFNTSGLLLFTNDGELANKLMHPSSNIDREYLVRVQGEVSKEQLQSLREGITLEDGMAKFTDITIGGGKGTNAWFYCTLMEGKNREVRRLWESQGCRVSRLKRVRYGRLLIPSYVRVGQWIDLKASEIALLCETAGLANPAADKPFQQNQFEHQQRREKRLRAAPPKAVSHHRKIKTAAERAAGMDRPWLAEKPEKSSPKAATNTFKLPTSTKEHKPAKTPAPSAKALPKTSSKAAPVKSRPAPKSASPAASKKPKPTKRPPRFEP